MEKSKAKSIILAEDTVNILFGEGSCAVFRAAFGNKTHSRYFFYPFSTCAIPKEWSIAELKRCNKVNWWYPIPFQNMGFAGFKRIVVWCDNTAHSLLSLALLSKTVRQEIFVININERFNGLPIGCLGTEEFQSSIDLLKKLEPDDAKMLQEMYKQFPTDRNCLKYYSEGCLKELSPDIIVEKILQVTQEYTDPVNLYRIIGGVMVHFNQYFGALTYRYLILELVRRGKLIASGLSDESEPERLALNIPPVLVNERDLRLVRRFRIAIP